MADLVITATSVVGGSDARSVRGTAGETITAGQAIYKSTTGKYMKADSNSATVEARRPSGIALNGASLNQPVQVQTSGDVTIGAALTAGLDYWLSDTPGGMCPRADIGSGEYVCLLGIAKSTTVLTIDIKFPNVSL